MKGLEPERPRGKVANNHFVQTVIDRVKNTVVLLYILLLSIKLFQIYFVLIARYSARSGLCHTGDKIQLPAQWIKFYFFFLAVMKIISMILPPSCRHACCDLCPENKHC